MQKCVFKKTKQCHYVLYFEKNKPPDVLFCYILLKIAHTPRTYLELYYAVDTACCQLTCNSNSGIISDTCYLFTGLVS